MPSAKFLYHLTGKPLPTVQELDEEIDHLMLRKGPNEPTYVEIFEDRNPSHQIGKLDSEVICHWLRRKFEPVLLLLMFDSEENQYFTKTELCLLDSYKRYIDKYFRYIFVQRRALQQTRKICVDYPNKLELAIEVKELQKTLNFLANHLMEHGGKNLTLTATDRYTPADVLLFNYLRRVMVGKYHTSGLRSHLLNCDPLKQFMQKFRSQNPHVIQEDNLEVEGKERSLIADATRPAIFAGALVLFFIWRWRN